MSLAEQTARVAGGGKNALKTIMQKLGVDPGNAKIDQYAALAAAISAKLLPDNLLSADTASLYGKSGTATPNEIFAYIANSIVNKSRIAVGSYIGTGTFGKDNPNSIILGFKYELLFVFKNSSRDGNLNFYLVANPDEASSFGIMGFGAVGEVVTTNSRSYGATVFESTETEVKWYNNYTEMTQLNESKETYWYVALGKDA